MRYTFDPAKQAANVAKHGVFFSAADGFDWAAALVLVHGVDGEARLRAMAPIGDRLHVLVCALRETSVRIISLRKANSREIRHYANR